MDGAKRGYVGHVLKMLKLSFRGTVGCFLYTTVAGESCLGPMLADAPHPDGTGETSQEETSS